MVQLPAIEARTERGTYRIWFDPARGGLFARVEVVRTGDHLVFDGVVSDIEMPPVNAEGRPARLEEFKVVVEHVHSQLQDGVWLPLEATVTESARDGSGFTARSVLKVSRKLTRPLSSKPRSRCSRPTFPTAPLPIRINRGCDMCGAMARRILESTMTL